MNDQPKIPQGLPIEKVMQLAGTAQGQAILSQLQSSHPKELETAIAQAQAGNFQQVQKTITEFLNSPAGKELLSKLRG